LVVPVFAPRSEGERLDETTLNPVIAT
jgi:hypothetical protein